MIAYISPFKQYMLHLSTLMLRRCDYDVTIEIDLLWTMSLEQFYTPFYLDHQIVNCFCENFIEIYKRLVAFFKNWINLINLYNDSEARFFLPLKILCPFENNAINGCSLIHIANFNDLLVC